MDLLERSAAHFGSYRAVAQFLGVTEQHISNIRHGKRNLQPIQAAKLAEAMGERWIDHVLPILAGLEPSEEDKGYWLGKLKRLATTGALVLIVGLAVMLHPEEAHAKSTQVIDFDKDNFNYRPLWIRVFSGFTVTRYKYSRTFSNTSDKPPIDGLQINPHPRTGPDLDSCAPCADRTRGHSSSGRRRALRSSGFRARSRC